MEQNRQRGVKFLAGGAFAMNRFRKYENILENMDSDFVRFKVSTDAPLRILGEIGETPAGAAIAPRIDCKEEGEE